MSPLHKQYIISTQLKWWYEWKEFHLTHWYIELIIIPKTIFEWLLSNQIHLLHTEAHSTKHMNPKLFYRLLAKVYCHFIVSISYFIIHSYRCLKGEEFSQSMHCFHNLVVRSPNADYKLLNLRAFLFSHLV